MNSYSMVVGEVQVQLLADDDAIVRMTKNNKRWEPETRSWWQRLVTPGELVIDVGAYTGIYAIASALMGAHVMAFEPHPANYRRLRANAALNSVRMLMLECALSDRAGYRGLRMKHPTNVISDTATLEGDVGTTSLSSVETKRLDDVMMLGRVALIKIDAEGHEPQILMGAMNTIMQFKPWVLAECLTPALADDVDCLMATCSYRCEVVLDKRNRLYRRVRL